VRSLTPVEAALGIAILGSVVAVGVPAFVRNLHASRLVEPMDGLAQIARAAAAQAADQPIESAYPASVGPTPAVVPSGVAVQDPPGTWQHPTWVNLGFGFQDPHRYSFEFESERHGSHARYRALARGDLDGDGQTSEFSVRGEVTRGAEPVSYPLEMHREME
jgi:hypothetical protein